jgi:hypothetical protein
MPLCAPLGDNGDGDAAESLEERAAIQGEDGDGELEPLLILKRRRVADMVANRLEPVIDHLVTRKATTLLSSAGGTGKTCALLQLAVQASLDLPVWDSIELMPHGPKWLYANAEDQLPIIDYWLGRILPKYDLQESPIDLFPICETRSGEFLLTPTNTRRLVELINAEQYDGVIIDTAISVLSLPLGGKFIDPLAIRGWLRGAFGLLQRETRAGFIMAVHDNRAGEAASGTADWRNFARLVLHLETAGRNAGETILTLKHIKGNLGKPFKQMVLSRCPRTLTARVTEFDWGDTSGTDRPATQEGIDDLLARIVRAEIVPLASEERTRIKVEAHLCRRTREHGIKRSEIRDFLRTAVTTENRKIGRTWADVVTGVSTPDSEAP